MQQFKHKLTLAVTLLLAVTATTGRCVKHVLFNTTLADLKRDWRENLTPIKMKDTKMRKCLGPYYGIQKMFDARAYQPYVINSDIFGVQVNLLAVITCAPVCCEQVLFLAASVCLCICPHKI